jgi:delta-aminolevulinic acid dehydratase/porphobilinogen synthase
MSTTTIRRYRVTTSVKTNGDWVNLTSVIDARSDLCKNELQIGTYAIEHFKQMLDDELNELKKGTKHNIIKRAIKEIKKDEKDTFIESDLHIHLVTYIHDPNGYEYEDQEVSDEEINKRFEINPFQNEVKNWIEYDIS